MIDLKKHQKDAVEFLSKKSGAGIFYEMGLGKTLIMLEHLNNIQSFPALIICPLSAVSVWAREAKKFGYSMSFCELTGTFQQRVNRLKNIKADVYVINYEGLRIVDTYLMQKKFRVLIADESHRLKSGKAIQTRKALELSKEIPYRYILSGTPVAGSPEDIWTQFQIIAPGLLGNWYEFRNKYVEYKRELIRINGGTRPIMRAIRFKNQKFLGSLTEQVSLRKTKKECLDLPEKIYKTVYCPLTSDQERHYFSFKTTLASILNNTQVKLDSVASVLQKLQQVCQGFIYDKDGVPQRFESSKIKYLKDLLEDLQGEKVILFTWFQADEDRLYDELKEDYKVIRYGGKSSDRANAEKSFQEDEGACIFLSQVENYELLQ